MMKISLRLPSGVEFDFEGDQAAFEDFKTFLADELPQLLPTARSEPVQDTARIGQPASESHAEERDASSDPEEQQVDIAAIGSRLDELAVTSDIERVSVMAQAALDAGREGLDYETADRLFTELGIAKPSVWRATFQNAKKRGYLQSVGRGLWKPTYAGENFARLGDRRAPVRKRARRRPAEADRA